jgi:hypothetical protein
MGVTAAWWPRNWYIEFMDKAAPVEDIEFDIRGTV